MALVALQPSAFITDAEVLQELIHVYRRRGEWNTGKLIFSRFAAIMRGRVEPMYPSDVEFAASFAPSYPRLSARDLIHLAVMVRVGSSQIVPGDRGFDGIAEVQRFDPANVASWRGGIAAP